MRIYLAASLFTHMESRWNRDVAEALLRARNGIEVVLPQDFDIPGRHGDAKRYGKIFAQCYGAIDGCDAVVAILEGAEVDSGTAWEVGYAFAKGIPVIGVRTDFRPGADSGLNIMLARSCRYLVTGARFDRGVEDIAERIARALDRLSPPTGKSAKKADATAPVKKTARTGKKATPGKNAIAGKAATSTSTSTSAKSGKKRKK